MQPRVAPRWEQEETRRSSDFSCEIHAVSFYFYSSFAIHSFSTLSPKSARLSRTGGSHKILSVPGRSFAVLSLSSFTKRHARPHAHTIDNWLVVLSTIPISLAFDRRPYATQNSGWLQFQFHANAPHARTLTAKYAAIQHSLCAPNSPQPLALLLLFLLVKVVHSFAAVFTGGLHHLQEVLLGQRPAPVRVQFLWWCIVWLVEFIDLRVHIEVCIGLC